VFPVTVPATGKEPGGVIVDMAEDGRAAQMLINYTPHDAQRKIHEARSARFRTVCTGRRFGKTLCMVRRFLTAAAARWAVTTAGSPHVRRWRIVGVEAFREIAPDFRACGRAAAYAGGVRGSEGAMPCNVFERGQPGFDPRFRVPGVVVDEAASQDVRVWN
jgi:hypothetical protein